MQLRNPIGRVRFAYIALGLCSVALAVFYWSTLQQMIHTWHSSRTYSHCFLILPLVAYLVWSRKGDLALINPSPDFRGLFPLTILAFAWLLGNVGDVKVVQEFAVVAMFGVLVWTLLGSSLAWTLRFPLFFLFFAVPFGVGLIRPLQDFTAWFVIHALVLSRIPAVLENHTLFLPSGEWTVAEACSGIRFLLSSLVVGTLFASIAYRSWRRRALFIGASIVAPILANGLRAYGIVTLAYLSDNKLAAGVDHLVYGGVFAVCIQLVLIVFGLRGKEQSPHAHMSIASSDLPPDSSDSDRSQSPGPLALVGIALLIIAIAPATAMRMWAKGSVADHWEQPPVTIRGSWQSEPVHDTSWAAQASEPDKMFSARYTNESRHIDLLWSLTSGAHPVDLANNYDSVDSPATWTLLSDQFRRATVNERPAMISRRQIQSGSVTRVVWTWFDVNGEYTASPAQVKLLQAKARMCGKTAAVATISVATDKPQDFLEADRDLQEFLLQTSFQNGIESLNRVVQLSARSER